MRNVLGNKVFKSFIVAILFVCLSFALVACKTNAVSIEITAPTSMKVGESITLTANVMQGGELTNDVVTWSAEKKSGEGAVFTLAGASLTASGEGIVTVSATAKEKTVSQDIVIKGFTKELQAQNFKEKYQTLLNKTLAELLVEDMATITAAIAEHYALTSDVKALLTDEIALINSFYAQIEQIKINTFLSFASEALAIFVEDVTLEDQALVDAVLNEYSALEEAVKSKLTEQYNHLVALSNDIAAQKDAAAFRIKHAAILSKTTATLSADDKTIMQSAINDYIALSSGAKDKLSSERSLLYDFEDIMAELEFIAAHSVALALTVDTVALADRAIIEDALEVFNSLNGAEQFKLEAQRAILVGLLEKINQIESAASTFLTAHSSILQTTVDEITVDNYTEKKSLVLSALTTYDSLDSRAKSLVVEQKGLLDELLNKCHFFDRVAVAIDNTAQEVEYNGLEQKISFLGILSGGNASSELEYSNFTIVYRLNSSDGAIVSPLNIGTYIAIVSSITGNEDYYLAQPVQITLNIVQANVVINAQKVQYVEVNQPNFELSFTQSGTYTGASVTVAWFSDSATQNSVAFSNSQNAIFYAKLTIGNANISAQAVVVKVVVYTPNLAEGAQSTAAYLAGQIDDLVEFFLLLSNIQEFSEVFDQGLRGNYLSLSSAEFIEAAKNAETHSSAVDNFFKLKNLLGNLSNDIMKKLTHHDDFEVVRLALGAVFVHTILDVASDEPLLESAINAKAPEWSSDIVQTYDFIHSAFNTLTQAQIQTLNTCASYLTTIIQEEQSALDAIGAIINQNQALMDGSKAATFFASYEILLIELDTPSIENLTLNSNSIESMYLSYFALSEGAKTRLAVILADEALYEVGDFESSLGALLFLGANASKIEDINGFATEFASNKEVLAPTIAKVVSVKAAYGEIVDPDILSAIDSILKIALAEPSFSLVALLDTFDDDALVFLNQEVENLAALMGFTGSGDLDVNIEYLIDNAQRIKDFLSAYNDQINAHLVAKIDSLIITAIDDAIILVGSMHQQWVITRANQYFSSDKTYEDFTRLANAFSTEGTIARVYVAWVEYDNFFNNRIELDPAYSYSVSGVNVEFTINGGDDVVYYEQAKEVYDMLDGLLFALEKHNAEINTGDIIGNIGVYIETAQKILDAFLLEINQLPREPV